MSSIPFILGLLYLQIFYSNASQILLEESKDPQQIYRTRAKYDRQLTLRFQELQTENLTEKQKSIINFELGKLHLDYIHVLEDPSEERDYYGQARVYFYLSQDSKSEPYLKIIQDYLSKA